MPQIDRTGFAVPAARRARTARSIDASAGGSACEALADRTFSLSLVLPILESIVQAGKPLKSGRGWIVSGSAPGTFTTQIADLPPVISREGPGNGAVPGPLDMRGRVGRAPISRQMVCKRSHREQGRKSYCKFRHHCWPSSSEIIESRQRAGKILMNFRP
jgi:hypothetical protein